MAKEVEGRELPEGVTVGHWSDHDGKTGCTVILVPEGAVGGVDVRGGAPGTLCTDALRPGMAIDLVNAVLLTGGSVYGLAAAAGIMRYLEELNVGFEIGPIRIPSVTGAVIFDLLAGNPRARPNAASGYTACTSAVRAPELGAVGAGTGASVAKAGDASQVRPGGVGLASVRVGGAVVSAIMVVNSVGGIWDDEHHTWIAPLTNWDRRSPLFPGANTTIGAVVTDAVLDKSQVNRVASIAHDGIARAVRPAHTMFDGDTMFCLATGQREAPYDAIEVAACEVVAKAIAVAVREAAR